MFKRALFAAFLLSLLLCAGWDFRARRRLVEQRILIAQKSAELETLRDFDREVRAYQKLKHALQIRIDVIDHLKQNQKTAAEAVAKRSTVEATSGARIPR